MKPRFPPGPAESEGNRQTTRISYILILATLGTYLLVGLISMSFHDWPTIRAICGGTVMLGLPFWLLKSGRFRAGNLLLTLIVVLSVTLIATVGQGIQDLAVVVYPIIFIYAGLTSDRFVLGACGGLTFLALLWLAFGESLGWFVTKPLFRDPYHLSYLSVLAVLLGITALAVDLLSSNIRRGLKQARDEIEERKRTEAALRGSEAKFRAVVENSYDGILFCDADARIHYRSPSYQRINGFADEERVGQEVFDTVHPEDLESVRGAWKRILEQPERSHSVKYRIRHRDGGWRWVETNAVSLLGNPDVQAVVVASRDATKRKRAEDALRASEERFRRLFQGHSVINLVIDPETGSILDANEAAAAFYGWPIEQLTGMRIQQINELPEAAVELEMGRASAAEQARFQLRHRLADGSVRDVEVFTSAIEIRGKEVLYSIVNDISERKLAEVALQESEERYRLMFESAPLAINISRGTTILYANPSYLRLFGFGSFEELRQQPPMQLFAPDARSEVLENIRHRALGLDVPQSYETSCMKRDGTIFPVILHMGKAVFADGPAMVAFVVDFTESRKAEQEKIKLESQLQQAQKMESVGRLAGGVAHDFNNMLGVILGHAEMALEQVDRSAPLRTDLEEIRRAAARSAELTRQLLSFARKQTVVPVLLDVSQTVEGMLSMLRRLIGEDIELLWRPDPGLWPVKVDPSQVDQILANLCVNARDAIADVGTITIAAENSVVSPDNQNVPPGEYVLLSVTDDGSGMDRDTLSHLFEPFFTTKALGHGTGLGLATVYGAVRQNNGFITVESERGRGTTFLIYLPRYAGKPAQLQSSDSTISTAEGHEMILVVEDEPGNLSLFASMLRRRGYSVLAAATPAEAVRLARANAGSIDLLLTDVIMPDMNGRDLAANLRSFLPGLAVIFMSGYTADFIANKGVLDEGVIFIQKPFSSGALAEKIRETLVNNRGR